MAIKVVAMLSWRLHFRWDGVRKHINKNFAEQVARSAERSDASNLDEVIKYVPA
jgi:hypothetical protein